MTHGFVHFQIFFSWKTWMQTMEIRIKNMNVHLDAIVIIVTKLVCLVKKLTPTKMFFLHYGNHTFFFIP